MEDESASEAEASSAWTPSALLDDLAEGVIALDPSWRIAHLNRAAAAHLRRFTGHAPAALLGAIAWEALPEVFAPAHVTELRRIAAGVAPVRFEALGAASQRWLAIRIAPSSRGLSIFFRDITEARLAQDALRARERSLRSVFDNSLEGILVTAPSGETFDANAAACSMLGRTAAEISGTHRDHFVDRDDPRVAMRIAERERTGRTAGEVNFVRADGTPFPVELRSAIFINADGQRRTILTFHDLTEKKRLERERARTLAALGSAEEQLRVTIDGAPIGTGLVGQDGRWIRVNPRLVEILGYPAEELLALPFHRLTHPDDRAADLALFHALARGELARGELSRRCLRKDGAIVDVLLSLSVLRDPRGAPRLFIAQVQDLREMKRLEAQLALSDRMAAVGTLASSIAHQIDGPLAHVRSTLERLGEELRGGGAPTGPARAVFDLVDEARAGAERVRKIVRGLGTFARAEPPTGGPVQVEAAIDVAVTMTANEIRHHARLVKAYGATPLVAADASRLAQVFVNLLVNAAQAIPEGRVAANEIAVTTFTDAEGRAVTEVSDTGPGIPAHLRARVFDPFFTTKAIGEGTGLGLSISHEIIAALGGLIEVTSEAFCGATFRVTLPAAAHDLAPPSASPPPAPNAAAARSRVLVVVAEAAVGASLQRGLGLDHAVTHCTSGSAAWAALEAGERFDVILCDVRAPDLAGPELHARLARLAPHQAAAMVFLTGGALPAETQAFLDGINLPTVAAPFAIEALRAIVRAILSRS